MPRKQFIKLSNLYLDLKNPRYEEQKSQNDALNTIAGEQKSKLLVLLKDILENGLNPSDIPIVMPDPTRGSGFVVLEGNRRIAALKLFKKSGILTNATMRQRYSKLYDEFKGKNIKTVECLIVNSREEANLWIERKHEGEMNGAGTVRWDNVQKSRFLANKTGKDSRAVQLIDFMKATAGGDKDFAESLQKVSATNLERLMGTPDVRSSLGLEYNDGEYSSRLEWNEVLKGLKAVVKRLSQDDFNVRVIYRKEDRMQFLHAIPSEELPNKAKKSDTPWKLREFSLPVQPTTMQEACEEAVKGAKKRDDSTTKTDSSSKTERPTSRTKFLPEDLTLSIPSDRVNRIYNELKQVSHQTMPNTCAVMLRVFLELSADYYLESFQLLKDGVLSGSRAGDLKSKVNMVIKNLCDNHYLDDSKAKGIRDELNARQGSCCIDSLNAYVHNLDFNPKPENLMFAWDNIQPFVATMWKAINDKVQ